MFHNVTRADCRRVLFFLMPIAVLKAVPNP